MICKAQSNVKQQTLGPQPAGTARAASPCNDGKYLVFAPCQDIHVDLLAARPYIGPSIYLP
eukprot:scaffold539519_cov29-Prasinocladus_malaysianus.AAC.1